MKERSVKKVIMKPAFLADRPQPKCDTIMVSMINFAYNDNPECIDQYFFERSILRELSGDVDF